MAPVDELHASARHAHAEERHGEAEHEGHQERLEEEAAHVVGVRLPRAPRHQDGLR